MSNMNNDYREAFLVLADGTVYKGQAHGAEAEYCGEVVFNTSLTGYQEIITDPSYKLQMVVFTNPQIGNYGVNEQDNESRGVFLHGVIINEFSRMYSNPRATDSLDNFLKKHCIPAISGVDTRSIVLKIREAGSMNGILTTKPNAKNELDTLKKRAKELGILSAYDMVADVTCEKAYDWHEPLWRNVDEPEYVRKDNKKRVAVIDFGVKYNSLRYLYELGCSVRVFPYNASFDEIKAYNPDGIYLSNGPGDPAMLPKSVVDVIRKLIENYKVFGVCLGHQVISLALGAKTYKLKFGHHGGNIPVKDLRTGKVSISSQNHCFAVTDESLAKINGVKVSHICLNDNTIEGITAFDGRVFSVQYHPEEGPGPHDARYHFNDFVNSL